MRNQCSIQTCLDLKCGIGHGIVHGIAHGIAHGIVHGIAHGIAHGIGDGLHNNGRERHWTRLGSIYLLFRPASGNAWDPWWHAHAQWIQNLNYACTFVESLYVLTLFDY